MPQIGVLQTITSGSVSMAGWSSCSGDELRVTCRDSNGSSAIHAQSNLDPESCKSLLYEDNDKDAFNRVLTTCLKEFPQTRTRPLPVILSDGKTVDLYELSTRVKESGGFDLVSAKKMWAIISEELGFGSECGPSLKLVYAKYLKLLDRWLQRVNNKKCNGANLGHQDRKKNGHKFLSPERKQNVEIHLGDFCQGAGLPKSPIVILDNHGPIFQDLDGINDIQATSTTKRTNGSLSDMLEWIKRVAISPCDSTRGQGFKSPRQNEEWVQESWGRANRVRELLYLRRQECPSGDVLYAQKKQKIHPSLYEESNGADHQALDRLRATQKRVELYGFQQSPSAFPSVATFLPGNHTVGSLVSSIPTCLDVQPVQRYTPGLDLVSLERVPRKRIPIGSYFQAVVPPWEGRPKQSENGAFISVDDLDDSRWLGIQIWPLKGSKKVVNKERIGKGRSDACLCGVRGSIECVRLHIQEERDRLKSELGSAFFAWRFDDMGEDVSRSWTPEEERKFRALVRLNPISLDKNFWNHLPSCFPSKSMEMLVSYYFNVFVLRRRSIQNRAMPEQIDSDDDEAEFGSIENFNMQGMLHVGTKNSERMPNCKYLGETSGAMVCHQNMQDNDFDMLRESECTLNLPYIEGQNFIGLQSQDGVSCMNYSMQYGRTLEGKSVQNGSKVERDFNGT